MGSFIGVDGAQHTPGNLWGHVQANNVNLREVSMRPTCFGVKFMMFVCVYFRLNVAVFCRVITSSRPWASRIAAMATLSWRCERTTTDPRPAPPQKHPQLGF